ncbi:MAG: GNAT family N-acetyltransferase [Phycisphaerae bacterium]
MTDPHSPIAIRCADPTDVDVIAAFNQALAAESEGRALDPSTLRAGVLAILSDERRGVYYVARRGGAVVGQIMLTTEWSDWRNGQFWWIQSVYVRPDSRGAGVYRALHEHVERLARATAGVIGLRLYVDYENAGAQRVYERFGMTRTDYHLYEIDFAAGATKSEE